MFPEIYVASDQQLPPPQQHQHQQQQTQQQQQHDVSVVSQSEDEDESEDDLFEDPLEEISFSPVRNFTDLFYIFTSDY